MHQDHPAEMGVVVCRAPGLAPAVAFSQGDKTVDNIVGNTIGKTIPPYTAST